MTIPTLLAPLFVQVLLTLVVMYTMAYRRFGAFQRNEVQGPIGLREANFPPYARQAEYNYQNQFELPVLFYVLTILVVITRHGDIMFVVMAWLFVLLRIVHAFVHLTSNVVKVRGLSFIAGAVLLTIMWLIFIVRIMLGLP